GQIVLQPHALRHDLVHGQARCHGAAAGIGQLQHLERALNRAVFSVAPVQGNEHAIKPGIGQFRERVTPRIEQVRIHADATQRVVHALPRHERHLTFGGMPAVQYAQAAKIRVHSSSPNWPGTRLTDPAAMMTTTSPSRTKSCMAGGTSATSSTNTGSTRPATRNARASARPSAATSGASPAAYTSVSSTASAFPITRTKSSKQSRVRV